MKKQINNYVLNIITAILCTFSVNAQSTILPVNSYGVRIDRMPMTFQLIVITTI